jgi:DNA-binding protein HU-beta
MGPTPQADAADAGTPVSIEAALRRVRYIAGALILLRFLSTSALPNTLAVLLVAAFWLVNGVSHLAQRTTPRGRAALGAVQLLADTAVVLLVVWAQHGRTSADSADWAILVLPVIEGAIRFQLPGAVASWLVLALGYALWNYETANPLEMPTLAQRLTVVFLVALPSGFLAEVLVGEIAAHRRGHDEAERRGIMLRAAALGGRRSTRLDVDEILEVLRQTIADMGFAEVQVFELYGTEPGELTARPVRQSRDVLAIAPGDPRLLAATAARASNGPAVWPPGDRPGSGRGRRHAPSGPARYSTLVALPIAVVDDAFVVATARWPHGGPPPASQVESLELFAAQAGASLRNAQVHRELQELKDRLAHEASHDPLTELPNRRRFTEQMERMCGRGRPGDLIAVLFLDLDGFKDVNDRFGPRRGQRPARRGRRPAAQLRPPRRRRRPDGRRRVHGPAHAPRERRPGRGGGGADLRDPDRPVRARPERDADLHEHRHRPGAGRRRRPGGPPPPGRRRDVPREVTGQGRLGDGPELPRARGQRLGRLTARPGETPRISRESTHRRDDRATMHAVRQVDGGQVNRSQLLNELAERNDMSRKEADAILTSLTDLITATVASGEDVAISGFAKFRRIDRPARMARNPATGEMVRVAAKRVARITPLKGFKDAVLSGKAPRKAAKKTAAKKTAKKAPAKKGTAKKTAAKKKTAKRR